MESTRHHRRWARRALVVAAIISQADSFSATSRSAAARRTGPKQAQSFAAQRSPRHSRNALGLVSPSIASVAYPSTRRVTPSARSLLQSLRCDRNRVASRTTALSDGSGEDSETNSTEYDNIVGASPIQVEAASKLSQSPAGGVIADAAVEAPSTLPSYRKLIVFTATTILIWLSEPLLSLVDTTIVGLKCQNNAVLQIAALGPATMLYDSAIYLTYFLAVATTNQLAPALAKKDYKKLLRTTSHVMGLATVSGLLVTAVTFGGGRAILAQLAGDTAISSPAIVPLANGYACIRAAAAPLGVIGFVAQSFCLACLDTKTPAIAVAVASIMNVIGDWAWSAKYGIAGAAGATALATVSSALILLRKVRKQTAEWKELDLAEMGITPREGDSKNIYRTLPNTRVDDGSIVMPQPGSPGGEESFNIPFASLPDRKSLIEFLLIGGPIFVGMLTNIVCYSILTLRTTDFGVIPLAAHNIMMRIFFFYACFGDSVSQAVQSFYPSVQPHERGPLLKRLAIVGAWLGVCNSQAVVQILKRLSSFLTREPAILNLMQSHTGFIAASVFLHPFLSLVEGLIVVKRDFKYFVAAYASIMALHVRLVFSPLTTTFAAVWRALFVFQALRSGFFGARMLHSKWKTVNAPTQ